MPVQARSLLSACDVFQKLVVIKDDKCQGRVKQDCLQAYFRAPHLGLEESKALSVRPPSIVHKVSVAQKCLHFCMTEPQYGRRRRQLQGSVHHDPRRCLQHRQGHRRRPQRPRCCEEPARVPCKHRRDLTEESAGVACKANAATESLLSGMAEPKPLTP